jgi:hypothetical protein
MISIRKKFGIATLPVQIVILLWGFILLFVPQNILNTEISVVGTAITLFLIMLPLFLSFFYLKKNENRFEPFDELTNIHMAKANRQTLYFNQMLLLGIGVVILFVKPTVPSYKINGWIFVIHSLTNIVQFLLFNHIDKTDKEETEE